jgi:hypothetical protein
MAAIFMSFFPPRRLQLKELFSFWDESLWIIRHPGEA